MTSTINHLPIATASETALLDLIEQHATSIMFTLGPRTPKSPPFYLLSATLRDGRAISVADPSRIAALRQAATAITEREAEAA